ncbi:MAG: hypothetical protein K2Q18_09335, partial [Bdellovibrionales bacterium]|nr:hypothetical protein [Bdellovibrionales bacterium]
MKQLLILFTMTVSTSVFAEVKTINLSPINTLVVTCPKGNELEVQNNTIKCACPKGTSPRFEGEVLKCDITCEIKEEHFEYTEEIYADQTAEVVGKNLISYDALVLRDLRGKILFSEKIYSPRKVELDFLFNEAVAASRSSCQRLIY